MDDRKETPEREIQEHCPEHWFTSWERECLRDAERHVDDEEDRIAADREQTAQRLWLAFQNSATAVAQLYKGTVADSPNAPLAAALSGPHAGTYENIGAKWRSCC